ncbi:MAG: hypothetical protein SFU25_09265 [Candidatus Caenarcaniphilales bacterium]|nr:hypothetical protein [Candidatus Caenarcaniphilales bacterium]
MQESFSERHGYKPIKILQLESIDKDLRISLVNVIHQNFFDKHFAWFMAGPGGRAPLSISLSLFEFQFKKEIWKYLKQNISEIDNSNFNFDHQFTNNFNNLSWYEVYDCLEFIAKNYPDSDKTQNFINDCNKVFEQENSGYRFIGNIISPITSQVEINEIEEALPKADDLYKVSSDHIERALELLSDKTNFDYRNSIKESISAVESICALLNEQKKPNLDEALKLLKDSTHGNFRSAIRQLYSWTSDDNGIRHPLMDESNLTYEEAKFMLVVCSAFVNYLKAKKS